jgi:NAD(P)-dependent dehydrogenase (short-subunit alcohol dehydrogenase family)
MMRRDVARTVVISGGGTGIGLATAEAFAREGDRVLIAGRRPEVLAAAAERVASAAPGAPAVTAVAADLADPEQVERLAFRVEAELRRVDVLVNNAGGNADLQPPPHGRAPGLAGVAESWLANLRANVLTAVLLTEALRDLLTSPGGRVMMLSSIAAYRGSGASSYGPAKAALHPFAYSLAAALGPLGITVNVVAPGFVDETEFFGGGPSAGRRATLVGETHTGRAGSPADVAETIRWLASEGAGHVTAQVIQVNGGAERGR